MSLAPTIDRADSALRQENAGLRARLEESEATLRAIRSGEVDAITVMTPQGEQIFTLQGADQPYRAMVETMGDGAVTITPDGVILYCNRRFAALVEADLQQVIGSPVQRFLGLGEADKFDGLMQQARVDVAGGRINLLRSNGTGVPTHVALRSLDTGGAKNVVVVVTDLTEVAAAQEKLTALYRDRELQFQESLSTYSTQIGTAGFVNTIPENEKPQALKILILEDEPTDAELMQRALRKAELDFAATRVATRTDFVAALEALAPDIVLADYKLPDFNGAAALAHVRHVHPEIPVVMVTGTLGDEGAVDLLKAGARDYVLKGNLARLPAAVERAISVEQGIRARKAAERALQLSEERYRTLVTATSQVVWTTDARGKVLEDLPGWRALTGLTIEESKGDGWAGALHPDDLKQTMEVWSRAVNAGTLYATEFRVRRADGEYRNMAVRGVPVLNEDGTVREWIGTYTDITERIRAGGELAESELKLRTILEAAGEGVLVADSETRKFVLANRAICDILGYSSEELIGLGVPDIHPPGAVSLAAHHFARVAAGESRVTVELPVKRKDGSEFAASITASPMTLGGRSYAVGLFSDITDRKAAERTLRRLNRTLRTLSRGNEALVRATSEAELLTEMCRVIVETGGYRMAWVGVPQQDAAKSITPIAWAGIGGEFFEGPPLHSWAGQSQGGCVCGLALNSGQSQTSQDLLKDPAMTLWHARFARHGISAAAAFPLRNGTDVFAVLTIYAAEADAFDTDELKLLQELANDLAFGIGSLRDRREHEALTQRWQTSLEATVGAIANTVEMRDPYTSGHQQRVARLAVAMAGEMALSQQQIQGLYLAGIIHDVGKIDVPSEILNRPGRLSKLQFQLIQGHAQAGYDIIKGVDFPWPIAQMVLQHHERLDGSGYPQGLKGDQILPEARILAIADVVEAMMSHRPYRAALGIDAALAEIEQGKGRLYDPEAVEACVTLFRHKAFNFDETAVRR